ncbi:MAG: hypothetical protein RL017_451 [Pseudomonadota bacterium]|jgi:hypothetical protein
MNFIYLISGIVAVAILIYLIIALILSDKF